MLNANAKTGIAVTQEQFAINDVYLKNYIKYQTITLFHCINVMYNL